MYNSNIKYSSVFRFDQALIACLYYGTLAGKRFYERAEIEHFFQTVKSSMLRDANQKTIETGIKHEMISESTVDEDVRANANFVSYSRALSFAITCGFNVVSETITKDAVEDYFGEKLKRYENSFFKMLGIPRDYNESFVLPEEEDYYISTKPYQMKDDMNSTGGIGLVLKSYVDPDNADPRMKNVGGLIERLGIKPFCADKIENGKEILANARRIIKEEAIIFADRFSKPKRKIPPPGELSANSCNLILICKIWNFLFSV